MVLHSSIVVVLLSLASLATSSPVDVSSSQGGLRIPLKKRANRIPLVQDGVVNTDVHTAARLALAAKHARNAESYWANTGRRIPGRPDPSSSDSTQVEPSTPSSSRSRRQSIVKRQREALVDYGAAEVVWVGSAMVGTPPRPYVITFDTGSADFWLDSTTIKDGYVNYDPLKSSTAVKKGGEFGIHYGDGSSVTGPIYTDVVSIAGMTVSNRYFAPVTQTTPGATGGVDQGLVGLGPMSISSMQQSPYFESLVSSRQLRHNLFSLSLRPSGSELLLGRFDASQFIGQLTYSPLVDDHGWIVSGNVFVNDKLSNANARILIDSGTSIIVGPSAELAHFFSLIPGARQTVDNAGQYEAPCDTLAASDLNVGFAGDGPSKRFKIPGPKLILGTSPTDPTYCISRLTAFDFGEWIFGDTFLLEVYTVFNVDRNAIGFAPMKPL